MTYPGNMLNKILIIGIIILFVGMSIVPSTSNLVEEVSFDTQILEAVNSSEEILFRGKTAYGFIAYGGSSGFPNGPCKWPLDDPGALESIDSYGGDWMAGGTWIYGEKWLACQYGTGILFEIDPETGDVTSIGGGGTSLYDLAWDDCTGMLYGTDGYSFYEIDIYDGEQIFSGSINISIGGIAFDSNCKCYGVGYNGSAHNLYTINFSSLEITFVGPLVNCSSFCNAEFDKDNDVLYLLGNGLYTCDTETGECTYIGLPIGGAEINALAIPYEYYPTPPVTTHTLDPPEPDGENGWYVSDITVTLNATDDMSGVKEIHYSINGVWGVIEGSNGTFVVTNDGWDIEIRYWAIDNAGNVEPKNTIMPLINIDQTPPSVVNDYEIDYEPLFGKFILFAMNATDAISGMNRVEFYMDDVLQKNITDYGPLYEWICDLSNYSFVRGFILNPEITEEYVRFNAILVRILDGPYRENIIFSEEFYAIAYDNAGNWVLRWYKDVFYTWKFPRYYMFESVTLPNSYKGYLGRFFVFATFDTRYQN